VLPDPVVGILIDTHAHLDAPEFDSDREDVLARAQAAGVRVVVSCGQDEASSRTTLALAARFAGLAPAVGVHPHCAKDAGELAWLPELLRDARVVAAGEMGLDYHYDFSPRETQHEVFAAQLRLASAHGLPAIVHCREALDDALAIVAELGSQAPRAVFHCFTGSIAEGERILAAGDTYLGIGGAVTFAKADTLREAVRRLPLERLVLETDCPFMTPAPHRGKRNEPAYVARVCQAVAEVRGVSPDEIAVVTTANALALFPKLNAFSEA
jgi:TatD DNase family protein